MIAVATVDPEKGARRFAIRWGPVSIPVQASHFLRCEEFWVDGTPSRNRSIRGQGLSAMVSAGPKAGLYFDRNSPSVSVATSVDHRRSSAPTNLLATLSLVSPGTTPGLLALRSIPVKREFISLDRPISMLEPIEPRYIAARAIYNSARGLAMSLSLIRGLSWHASLLVSRPLS